MMIVTSLVLWASLQGAQSTAAPVATPIRDDAAAAEPFIRSGLALYWKLRFQGARAEFQKAVDADPSSAAAHFYLGYTLYKIAEPTRRLTPEKIQAKEQFARCFELDPGFRPTFKPR